MPKSVLWSLFAGLCLALITTFAVAQDADAPADALTDETVPPAVVAVNGTISDLPDFNAFSPDYAAWDEVAGRAEELVLRDVASRFALSRQREALVEWRDAFSSLLGANAGRLETLAAQLAALGEPPAEGEEEPEAIATRRATLTALQAELRAPQLLVEEGFARANGLISEIDALIRNRETEQLLVQGPSPLNPAVWSAGGAAIWQGVLDMTAEMVSAVRNHVVTGDFLTKLPLLVLYAAVAFILLLRHRRGLAQEHPIADGEQTPVTMRSLLHNLAQLVLPIIGLVALTLAIFTLDPSGVRSAAVFGAVPAAGLLIIVGRWLSFQFFPLDNAPGLLAYDAETRASARFYARLLAWVTAVWTLLLALLSHGSVDDTALAVANFPIIVVLGLILFRLGQLLRRAPMADMPEGQQQQGRIRGILGQFCQAVAIGAPVAAAFGFSAGAQGVILPTIMSLAVLGIVIFLQRLVNDIYAVWARARGRQTEALMPVVIGFVLLIVALPILALIWGARLSELLEVWARFREGFSLGDTRVSPTDFMTFVIAFAIGYLLTRLVQGTLRTTVLPRTRLDLGGQNAVVSGFGYIGIGLSAIVAITSAGIDLSSLAFVAGALSVGIGFGLQNIVSNFVSGIILLIERPVSEGDWIEVGGQMGYVRDISVRSTRIETFDRTDVIVPNADLVSNQVTNWTRGNLVGRVIVPVGVAYGSDVDKVTSILREIAEAHPMVLMTPPPSILFMAFGASSLDFEIRAILRDVNFVLATQSEMNFEIARRFAEEGIEIPFPQRDLWLRNGEVLRPVADASQPGARQDPREAGVHLDETDFDAPADGAEGET
ncbi:DUF3772 domain-containing protein [Yoonia sp. 208BN28-4]|uniref:DUF3772 domain-containing protein n=1 Tax=Yoonia sp. 208BN28-4 TaxID=3126505 RepID=UPI00309EE0DB